MRVISQDGTIDVPYEHYAIWCYKDQYLDIYHIACDCGETGYRRLADYSAEAKAVKAMEMLREQYKKYVGASVNIYGIFQFPQDDEIEV